MTLTPEFILLSLAFLWFLALTFLFLRFYFYYMKLVKSGKKNSLPSLLEDLNSREELNKKKLEELVKKYDKLMQDGKSHIQKVGLIRFNPFKDTGGDQSFILALVDAENTGVVISSLHTRTGTRWYAKNIVKGKGIEHELSAEEKKALQGAQFLADVEK